MWLAEVEIRNIRILREVRVTPERGVNLLIGPNGSGKSSFLEGVHLLGMGRSFRGRSHGTVIREGSSELTVRGVLESENGGTLNVGVEKRRGGGRIRIEGKEVKAASELARRLPLVVISPDSQRLVTDGGVERRRLMDWALFHVEPAYLPALQRYYRALRQRNAALRDRRTHGTDGVWKDEMVREAERVDVCRRGLMTELLPLLAEEWRQTRGLTMEAAYVRGWKEGAPLEEVLRVEAAQDNAAGYTRSGPQRADIRFRMAGKPIGQVLSRGEAKVFVFTFLLLMAAHLARRAEKPPVLLVDEIGADLDGAAQQRVLAKIGSLGLQAFVTTVADGWGNVPKTSGVHVFHVEQGEVKEML